MLNNDWIALAITLILALAWLRINDFFAHRGWISGSLSRKIIHTGTGPIFVLCWLLFSDSPAAPFMAALVPLGITIQFFLIGTGILKDQSSVEAMSRTGDRREILRGPLFYGIVFVILTIFFWKQPVGIIALMLLCGGDGMADVIGKRVTRIPLPWSKEKSLAGTIAMFAGGWILSMLVLWAYSSVGVLNRSILTYIWPVTIISLVGMVVESLPFKDIDNVTVPAAAVLLGLLLL